MKKIAGILAALLLGAATFSAQAQLSIGKKSDGAKQLTTLRPTFIWLYEADGHIFYVSKTDNQFDDWMWLDLGTSKEEAAQTVLDLSAALQDAEKGQSIEVESMGERYDLVATSMLGSKYFMVMARDTRKVYAGTGQIVESELRKAYKYLTK